MYLGNKGEIVFRLFKKGYSIEIYELPYYLIMSIIFLLLVLLTIRVMVDRIMYKEDKNGNEVYVGGRYIINHPILVTPLTIYFLYKSIISVVSALGIVIMGRY